MKALKFEGSAGEYFKIWIVNIFLTIITLGIYYPWAKVRERRYFYANTLLDDRNFEYHAVGKQLLIGHLIAIALLIIYVVIQKVSPIGSLVLIGALFLAIPWIILRSMTFGMKMTSFSNVRFEFAGKLGKAYINFFVYPIALYIGFILIYLAMAFITSIGGIVSVLLGIALSVALFAYIVYGMAFIKKNNTEYFIDNSKYGQGFFQTALKLKTLMIIRLKTMGVGTLAMIVAFIVVGVGAYLTVGIESFVGLNTEGQDPEVLKERIAELLPIIGAIYGGMIFAMIFVMAYSVAKHREYIYANTILDNKITFASTLQALPLAWVLISNFIIVILTLGFGIPWAKVRVARVMLENTLVNTENGFDEYISQKQAQTSSVGEQIGDAFDVDVDIGL